MAAFESPGRKPRVVVTGDLDDESFDGSLQDTIREFESAPWQTLCRGRRSPGSHSLDPWLDTDLLVIAQSRRGQFCQAEIDCLKRQYPLAAMVVVYGPWCEGETRSGTPLAGVIRLPASCWAAAFARFLCHFAAGGCSPWHGPETLSCARHHLFADRQFVAAANCLAASAVGLLSHDRALLDSLQEALTPRCRVVQKIRQFPLVARMDAIVVDCYFGIEWAIDVAGRLPENFPLLAITGFPRSQDYRRLVNVNGRARLIGKPFCNDQILHGLGELILATEAEPATPRLRLA